MISYGQYGIGFNKSWGEKIGLTPVIYYNENSPYIENMKAIYNEKVNQLNCSHDEDERSAIVETIRILKSTFTMYKPIHGKYERRPDYGDNYYFYNEREWRYLLPAIKSTAYLQDNNLPQYFIDYYNGVEKDGKWKPGQLELEKQIEFTYEDLDFVIIPSTCDKNSIIEKLTVPQNDIEKIKNKIKTIEVLIAERS
jgi:hypothetical protein